MYIYHAARTAASKILACAAKTSISGAVAAAAFAAATALTTAVVSIPARFTYALIAQFTGETFAYIALPAAEAALAIVSVTPFLPALDACAARRWVMPAGTAKATANIAAKTARLLMRFKLV